MYRHPFLLQFVVIKVHITIIFDFINFVKASQIVRSITFIHGGSLLIFSLFS